MYDRASTIVVLYSLAGFLLGAIAAAAVAEAGLTEAALVGIPAGLVGYLLGSERAFWSPRFTGTTARSARAPSVHER